MPAHAEAQSQLILSLLALASQGEAYHLAVELNGRTITVSIGQPAAAPASGRKFTRLEVSILAAVTSEWTTSDEIARAANERHGEALKAMLANLVELGAIESAPGRGYRRKS